MTRSRSLAAGLPFLCLAAVASAELTPGPKERTEKLVAVFKSFQQAEPGKIRSGTALDEFFDFDTLVSQAIAPHKKKLTREQLAKYKELFREVLRTAPYLRASETPEKVRYTIGEPDTTDGRAKVPLNVSLPDKDIDSTLVLDWREQGGVWRVVDVALDGASLVKDYQNQFGRIIQKEGAEGLLKRLQARLDQAREKRQHT